MDARRRETVEVCVPVTTGSSVLVRNYDRCVSSDTCTRTRTAGCVPSVMSTSLGLSSTGIRATQGTMPAARSVPRSTTERSITQMPSRAVGTCVWCGEDCKTTITDEPVEEVRYRILYHKECRKQYLKYSEELNDRLQRLYGTKRRRYERLK
jgi:hypothetical protein